MMQKLEIRLPEGTFRTYCEECAYADWSDWDRKRRIYCHYPMFNGYIYPRGCSRGRRK